MVIKYDESSAFSDQWIFHWFCPSVRLSHMNYVEYMSVKFIYTIKKCKKSIHNYRKNTKENMVRSKCMNHFWSQIILNLTGSDCRNILKKKNVFFSSRNMLLNKNNSNSKNSQLCKCQKARTLPGQIKIQLCLLVYLQFFFKQFFQYF